MKDYLSIIAVYLILFCGLLLTGCKSSDTRTKEAGTEKSVEREVSTEQRKGTEAGQPTDVVVTRTTQKDKLTEREARIQANTTNTVEVPSVGGIGNVIGGLLTGNWATAAAALASLLIGKVVGRKGAESQMAEITEGVSNFAKANPDAGEKLGTQLSMAMSKSTKQTVRRIKP
jgi:bifunctional ADP-heptose synthase (sugar kinase/adenylyltransferase)